jgi:glycosyltransferase involved in cell wall biosynthesis
MKILYLITGLRLGGAEKQLMLMASEQKKLGNEVLIVSMESNGYLVPEISLNGLDVIELNITGLSSLYSGYKRLARAVKKFRPDILHAHMVHANLLSRIYKYFNSDVKLLNTAHNINEGKLLMKFYLLTNSIPDWSTNVSNEAYSYFIERGYFKKQRSSVIYNAIDTDIYNRDALPVNVGGIVDRDSDFIFLFAGRLHSQKNIPMLLSAFAALIAQGKKAHLLIVGDGVLMSVLKDMATELGIAEYVSFLGNRDDLPLLMKCAGCFVLSSSYEGFGLVIGEAMACGIPVVATDSGGVAEVMGPYGQLVKKNDIHAFSKVMLNQMEKAVIESDLADARSYICQRFGKAHIADQWLQLYRQIL